MLGAVLKFAVSKAARSGCQFAALLVEGFMNSKRAGLGFSLGLCFGAALGTALHNLGWSSSAIGVGIAVGVSLGTVASSEFVFGGRSDAASARKEAVSDKPLPHPLGL